MHALAAARLAGQGRARQVEAVVFQLQAALQPRLAAPGAEAVQHGLVGRRRHAHAELRAALIGRVELGQRISALQRLPVLQPRIGVDDAPGQLLLARHIQVAGQQARRLALDAARHVLPVVVVGHALAAQPVAPVCEIAVVVELETPARMAEHAVTGQQVDIDAAGVTGLQVTELAVQAHASLGHDEGRERRIPLRRDVPVVGHAKLEAAAVVQEDIGRQPARLALRAEREAQGRRRQDGHAQEAQHRAIGLALVGGQVHAQPPGRDLPVGLLVLHRRAARVGALGGAQVLAIDEVDDLGLARTAGRAEEEARRQELAFEAAHIQPQRRAREDIAPVADVDVAIGLGQVLDDAVVQRIGTQQQLAIAQLDTARPFRLLVGLSRQLAGADDQGRLVARLDRGTEHAAASQQQRRLIGGRLLGQGRPPGAQGQGDQRGQRGGTGVWERARHGRQRLVVRERPGPAFLEFHYPRGPSFP